MRGLVDEALADLRDDQHQAEEIGYVALEGICLLWPDQGEYQVSKDSIFYVDDPGDNMLMFIPTVDLNGQIQAGPYEITQRGVGRSEPGQGTLTDLIEQDTFESVGGAYNAGHAMQKTTLIVGREDGHAWLEDDAGHRRSDTYTRQSVEEARQLAHELCPNDYQQVPERA